jgi:EAL domain-containing protein (putative c-di-GMP-specific phosphodiesterase class I)
MAVALQMVVSMGFLHSCALPGPLGTVLQPIVDGSSSTPTIFAVECLTRGPRGSKLEEATPLFTYVRRRGLEKEMDRVCVSASLRLAAALPHRISINVHPSTLGERRDFVAFLLRQCVALGIDPKRLIVEIGEQSPAADAGAFRAAIAGLREAGVAVAVDDVGYGHSNYKTILDCAPEYLKIDRYFVQEVADDRARRAVVQSICDLAAFFGATVIAEGVERHEDLEALRDFGISLFQGFLFSRPVGASRDRLQHPIVDRILQRHKPRHQALIQIEIDHPRV